MLNINQIYNIDCLDGLKQIDNESVDLILTSPPYDCYSEDTEVLTINGWKLIKDVVIGENVLSLDPKTKQISYQKVIANYSYPFNGQLVNFKNTSIDILITPNHKMYVEYRNGDAIRERIPFVKKDNLSSSFLKTAESIKISDLLRLNGFDYIGHTANNTKWSIPSYMSNRRTNNNYPSINIDIDIWLAFFGLWLAEGSASGSNGGHPKRKRINITQKNGKNINLIKNLLNNLPFVYKSYLSHTGIWKFEINNCQLHNYMKQFGNSYSKFIPREILNLSKEKLNILLKWYLLGDGTKTDNCSIISGFSCANSYSRQLRLDIMEICIKLGFLPRERKHNYVVFPNSSHSKIGFYKKYKTYIGLIVCLEVKKNNIICVKRNGKTLFCGNSIRSYNNHVNSFQFESTAKESTRVLKPGGMIVWVVNDQYINGSRSLTSFKQCIYFKEQCGLNVHDIIIYQKSGFNFPANNRYHQVYEFMLCLSKGSPKTFNPLIDRKNAYPGQKAHGKHRGHNENDYVDMSQIINAKPAGEYGKRYNIWYYKVGGGHVTKDKIAYQHPAIFPEELAKDHILSWTNPGDLVMDIFSGSGTTCKMAKLFNRNYLGMELNREYHKIAIERLNNYEEKKEMLSLPSIH